MRAFLVISFLLSFEFSLYAQVLRGKVLDENTKQGIPFAQINFVDLQTGVVSNENGAFEYRNILPKVIKVRISALGYQNINLIIEKPFADTLIIFLKGAHIELNEVTISSTTGTLQKYNITNVESKSMTELSVQNPTTLGEAISNMSSVYQTSTGLGISKPVIRGLSGMRVISFLNGLRIENQQWGGDHGMGINENGIGNVEVIKGPSSLLYGADAMGGVVYFTDEAYAKQNEIQAKVESRYETNTSGSNNFATLKFNKNNLRFNLHANYANHADFTVPGNKYVKNSAFIEQNYKVSMGYNYKNWILNLRYNYLDNRVSIPGHSHDSVFNSALFKSDVQKRSESIPAQIINNHYTLIENIFYLGKSDIKIWLGNTQNHLREFEEKITIPSIDMNLNNYFLNSRIKKQLTENSFAIMGVQSMYQDNTNSTEAREILITDSRTQDLGVYSLFQAEFNSWEVQTGLRYDIRKTETKLTPFNSLNFSKQYQGLNYSGGASKRFDKFSFRFNFSSGFRPPHLSELLSNGVHHGVFRYEIGDKGLKSEYANQADWGVEYASEHIRLVVNPFFQYIQNFIYVSPSGQYKEGLPEFYYKQAQYATLSGGDIAIHYHPHFFHPLHIENNISYIYGEDNLKSPLPLIPQTRFNTNLRFEINSKGKLQLEYISLQHLYFLEQDRVVTFELPSSEYQLFHISAGLKTTGSNPLYLRLGVKNIFDARYIDHLSRLKNIGIENPGRNFFISLKYIFNYNLSKQP